MSTFIVNCPHCAKPSQLDSAKLPDQPVFFPCPHCKGRVVVDKRKLGDQPQAPVAPPTPSPSAELAVPPTPPSPQDAVPPLIAGQPRAITPPAVEPTVPDRRFVNVPSDAGFPSGIIVGEDESVIDEIREALAALGSQVDHIASAEEARKMIVNEHPELCIYVAGEIQAAPHVPMAPLMGLHPGIRRRLYLTLVADNLKTFDGNAAFMHQVNMILGREDLPQLGPALFRGLDCHRRLYKTYLRALEQ